MPKEPTMSPALLTAVHDDLDHARRMLDRCMARVSAMASLPGLGDEPAMEVVTGAPRRLPAPPLPRRNLPPED